jgi:hypothetical protein
MSKKKLDEKQKELTEAPQRSTEEEIELMASCGFTNSEMAAYLQVSKKQFLSQALTPDTQYYNAILKGKLSTEIAITEKLRLLAATGNITAVQQFEKRLAAKKLQEIKERIYFGE